MHEVTIQLACLPASMQLQSVTTIETIYKHVLQSPAWVYKGTVVAVGAWAKHTRAADARHEVCMQPSFYDALMS